MSSENDDCNDWIMRYALMVQRCFGIKVLSVQSSQYQMIPG
jgi:hypothetical protein